MTTSEFGKGLAYCLGLFLAHAERYSSDLKKHQKNAENNMGISTKILGFVCEEN